jgi:predicted metal-dependent hydrolase
VPDDGSGTGAARKDFSSLILTFRVAFQQLKPRTPVPEMSAEFFPFAGLNHTVRLREEKLLIRVSDLFVDAPDQVIHSLALILLGKLYRRKIEPTHARTYRAFALSSDIQERARQSRRERGRLPVQRTGRCRDLDSSFDRLNAQYFDGELNRPVLSWSAKPSRHTLGRYDATRHAIFISRYLDSFQVPEYVLDYVLFHEMLHVKHQSRVEDCRLLVHTREFRSSERRFHAYEAAKTWLRRI